MRPWTALPGWLGTMLVVVVGWVFFRATTFDGAWAMLLAMFGRAAPSAGAGLAVPEGAFWWLAAAAAIALLAPNTQQYFARYQPAIEPVDAGRLSWRPNLLHGLVLGAMLFLIARKYFTLEPSAFLYFNF